MTEGLKTHPLADAFPRMPDDEYRLLVDSIRENGLREAVVLLDGEILDGRHRHTACLDAGVEPRFVDLPDGSDPVAFVVDANMRRRHLTESQRGAVTAELANTGHGGYRTKGSIEPLNNEKLAEAMNVGLSTVKTARKVKENAPEVFEASRGRRRRDAQGFGAWRERAVRRMACAG